MKLTIVFLERAVVDGKDCYWFELSTEQETCQCCYEREGETYVYLDGDNEPDMPHELRVLFDEVGDEAFDEAIKSWQAELSL